jgi:hypothetical protein
MIAERLSRRSRMLISIAATSLAVYLVVWIIISPEDWLTDYGVKLSHTISKLIVTIVFASFLSCLVYRTLSHYFGPKQDRVALPVCTNCGYNLTGNISGTCPEYGQPVAGPPGPTG